MLSRLETISVNTYLAPYPLAAAYAGMNRKEAAMEWLESAYEEHSDQITYIGKDPRFDSLRNEPGFQELLRKIGL